MFKATFPPSAEIHKVWMALGSGQQNVKYMRQIVNRERIMQNQQCDLLSKSVEGLIKMAAAKGQKKDRQDSVFCIMARCSEISDNTIEPLGTNTMWP